MDNRKNTLTRSYFITFCLLIVGVLVALRIVHIQQTELEKYKEQALKTNFRQAEVPAARGNIYSSDGVLLATTILRYDIHMDVMTVQEDLWNENITALSDSLSKILQKPAYQIKKNLIQQRKKKNRYYLIARNIDYNQFNRMKRFPIFKKGQNRGGFIVNRKTARIQPADEFGQRVLGFDDERGSVGLEGAYKEYLEGKNGRQMEQFINGKYWKPIDYWHPDNEDPVDGYDVYTTIDTRIQDITNAALRKQLAKFEANHGCVVVMEVASGRIMAMSNFKRMEDGSYRDVYNYAVGERTEPGSTFKVISLMAALDDGYIDPNTTVNIGNGSWNVYKGNTIYDDHGSGTLTITQVLSESSNIGTAKTIYKYYRKNPENFLRKIDDWGVSEKVGIEIKGEPKPVVPHPGGERWSPIALPWMAYGYGVALTPLQTLNFYNAVANDGVMVKPRLIEKIEREGITIDSFQTVVTHKNIASKKARDLMEKMLIEAVESGTAESIFTPNLKMAGKTGTAQYEYWNWKNGERKYQSSFCGYFPADAPKYSCIVVINQPNTQIGFYGSQVAAPVFKEIAGKVFLKTPLNLPKEHKNKANYHLTQKFQTRPKVPSKWPKNSIPNLVGLYGQEVIPELENHGYKVSYTGVGKVKQQSISPGVQIKKGATIYLELQ